MAPGRPLRVAVEGCGHGALDAIYDAVATSAAARGWDGVDVLIILGDFQAVRNAADLTVMSCPVKYRHIGDFYAYYSGSRRPPCLTIFIGGNHEASSHLRELYHGGWAAPGIYYLGAAGVIRLGPLRIAGLSGIWHGHHHRLAHHERLPFSADDIRSAYHVREIDVRRLNLMRSQVDIGLSHDWPRGIELQGDTASLFRAKPFFRNDSQTGRLGSPAASDVMDHLRPPYWFSAHLHCKFSALRRYEPLPSGSRPEFEPNPDQIALDDDDGEPAAKSIMTGVQGLPSNPQKLNHNADDDEVHHGVTEEVLDRIVRVDAPQLAAAIAPPVQNFASFGEITNTEVQFLALDKCLPGRRFLELMEIEPHDKTRVANSPLKLEYDPEWLSITRATAPLMAASAHEGRPPPNLGDSYYRPLVEEAREWVDEHIVREGMLIVPDNFAITAPPYIAGEPEIVHEQPFEYTNPQTEAFCALLGIENLWDASEAERIQRRAQAPPPAPAFQQGRGPDRYPNRSGRVRGRRG